MSYQATKPVVVHHLDVDWYYMDFGPILKGRTISAIATLTITGSATVGTSSVLSTDTTVIQGEDNSALVEANTGIKFKLSNLAAATEYTVTASVTLSDGGTQALEGILKTG